MFNAQPSTLTLTLLHPSYFLLPWVRFIISDIKPDSCKFEQSFSTDGGKTWEANWVAIDTRVKE